jgi:hypothetical protein
VPDTGRRRLEVRHGFAPGPGLTAPPPPASNRPGRPGAVLARPPCAPAPVVALLAQRQGDVAIRPAAHTRPPVAPDPPGTASPPERSHRSEADIVQALFTTCEAARYCRLSPRTLEKYRLVGGGPLYVHISERAIRYRLEDLDAWISGKLRRTTSDPSPPSQPRAER